MVGRGVGLGFTLGGGVGGKVGGDVGEGPPEGVGTLDEGGAYQPNTTLPLSFDFVNIPNGILNGLIKLG